MWGPNGRASMSKFQDRKSLFAKLLAQENITVMHDANLQTASFDVVNRVLMLPDWGSEVSDDVYDLFCGHETSHALHTPASMITEAETLARKYDTTYHVMHQFFNVIEDVRIDKLQIRKYPGLRPVYTRAYRELWEDEFFGKQGRHTHLLDRVNVFYKVGVRSHVRFSAEELDLVERIGAVTDASDVAKLVEEAYLLCGKTGFRQPDASKLKYMPGDRPGGGAETNDDEVFQHEKNRIEEAPVTPSIMTDKLEKLLSDSKRRLSKIPSMSLVVYPDWETEFPKIVIPYKEVYQTLTTNWENALTHSKSMDLGHHRYREFIDSEKANLNYMVKEFESHKAADAYARQRIDKTGQLNADKLYSYKYNSDLFKKSTVVPEGKNHGLIFFLDWSGSMREAMQQTIKQTILLIMFCRRVNIPFEVYAFSDVTDKFFYVHGRPYSYGLINLLSSRMSGNEIQTALRYLFNWTRIKTGGFDMGGTPLLTTIIMAEYALKEFRARTKVQIPTMIFLTDGETDEIPYMYGNMLIDKKMNLTYGFGALTGHQTPVYLSALKNRVPECNLIGIRLVDDSRDSFFVKNGWRVDHDDGYDSHYHFLKDRLTAEKFIWKRVPGERRWDVEWIANEVRTQRNEAINSRGFLRAFVHDVIGIKPVNQKTQTKVSVA